jgi:RNA polymerase sigma-70 factor (ECF subfamily)
MGNSRSEVPTDAQLLAASRFDGVHFAPLFDRHAPQLHGYLSRRLGPPAADGHLGDAFAAAYGGRRQFRAWGESARPWLLGVATGIARKHWRVELDQLRANGSRRIQPFGAATTTVAAAAAPAAAVVLDRLQHLPARDRDVAILAAWEGLDHAAISCALDLPDSVVGARLAGIGEQLIVDARTAGAPGDVELPADGLDLVRALRPVVAAPDRSVLDPIRRDLAATVGTSGPLGRRRPTAAIAAEREQLRRWRSGPGVRLASRPAGPPS